MEISSVVADDPQRRVGASWISKMHFILTDLTVVLCVPDVFCMAADVGIGPTTVQMHRWLTWGQHVKYK